MFHLWPNETIHHPPANHKQFSRYFDWHNALLPEWMWWIHVDVLEVVLYQILSVHLRTSLSQTKGGKKAFHQNVFSTWCLTNFWFVAVSAPSLVTWLNYSKQSLLWRNDGSCSELMAPLPPFLYCTLSQIWIFSHLFRKLPLQLGYQISASPPSALAENLFTPYL